MTYEQAKTFFDKNPHLAGRSNRYRATANLFGISEEEAKAIINFDRYVRMLFPKDAVGEAKEKEYHKTPQAWQFENETHQTFLKLI